MAENEGPYHRYLFTVRLWRAELEGGETELRGRVQYAIDGERRAFQDWPELIAFFMTKLQEGKQGKDSD